MVFHFVGGISFWGPALLLCAMLLTVCCFCGSWRQLLWHRERLTLWLASIVGLALFWHLQVEVRGLLAMHPLLMMALCMVFGPSLAMITGSLAIAANLLMFGGSWLQWPLQCLLNVIVPGLTAALVLRVIESIPGRNVFVFTLGGGFLGAMLTVQAMALASLAYVWLLGPAPLLVMVMDHYYLSLLLTFPEGFMNGALVTVLTVLRPELVKTYDDRIYLNE